MHFTKFVLAIAASLALTIAHGAPAMDNETTALNYALSMEQLQAEFYKQGLAKFKASNFTDAGYNGSTIHGRFVEMGNHEREHVEAITAAINKLKKKPVDPCTYKFPLENVTSFLTAARAMEQVGVSAYLGAAAKGDIKGDMLATGASVASVEARQAAYLNTLFNQSAFPYAMDTPLSPRQVATIASEWVESCPYNTTVKPYKTLNATWPTNNTGTVLTSYDESGNDNKNANKTLYCQFLYGDKVDVSTRDNCTVPTNATGYMYLMLTDSRSPVTSKNENSVVAGPTLLFNQADDNKNSTETMPPPPTNTTVPA
ncbi:hypothetical protein BG004_000260 [Podila humilis]|nr:hypothetical protein BG004_000260 [Podila humilis]